METRFAAAVKVVLCGGLAFFCSFLDRLAWPPVIPLAARELGLTAAQAGGFMSAFFFRLLADPVAGRDAGRSLGNTQGITVLVDADGNFYDCHCLDA